MLREKEPAVTQLYRVEIPPFSFSPPSRKLVNAINVIKKEIPTEAQPRKPARWRDIPFPNQLRRTKPARGEININQQ
jgi:hypothetical protein